MENETPGFIYPRKNCPVCLNENLPAGIPPHVGLKFPMLPVCVDTRREEDIFAPFTITICNKCGLILLREVTDPSELYKIFHSDGIGRVWERHYEKFASLIARHHKEGRLLEIGAGQGKLTKKLLLKYNEGIEVIDPQYEGPRENVKVHGSLLSAEIASGIAGQFSSVVSSHMLEHLIDFNDYFQNARTCLKEGGMLFTSVPNQEYNFAKGYGNQLHPEHQSVCTNAHWVYLHYKNGFVIRELSFFMDHSVQIAAQKVAAPLEYSLDAKELSQSILTLYETSIKKRIATVRELAKPDKENWIFGASNFTQPLFVYGLEDNIFQGVLDNSPFKHNKRLYGTSLVCRKPEDAITRAKKPLRVFLNIGQYNDEVKEQLLKLDSAIEIICL